MNAVEIVITWLKNNGYDGLYTEDCGCLVDDLMPCGVFASSCEPGYKVPCPGSDDCENAVYSEPCEWHVCGIKT